MFWGAEVWEAPNFITFPSSPIAGRGDALYYYLPLGVVGVMLYVRPYSGWRAMFVSEK